MVTSLIETTKEPIGEETTISTKCIEIIMSQCSELPEQIFLQLLTLLLSVLTKQSQTLEDGNRMASPVESPLMCLSRWLLSSYLFSLQKSIKHIKNKNIRKICYYILQEIAKIEQGALQEIVELLLNVQEGQRGNGEEYEDFRAMQYIGLKNLGSTCYINSLLQQLYHTKFPKLLVEKDQQNP